jgi:hypothetical protein
MKVDLVTTALSASMTSDRLEDLELISPEKNKLDALDLESIIIRFAASSRELPS